MSGERVQELVARGLALHQAGSFGEAEALYRRVLEMDPRHAAALTMLATVHAQRRDLAEAARLFEKSLEVDPRQVGALYNRGIVLEELKRLDEAVASYDRALALKADSPEILNNRGNALAKLRRFPEAVESYDRAIALRSNYADAHLNRGSALAEIGRFEEALDCFERVISLQPVRAEAHHCRANVLAQLKRYDRALEGYDRAVALDPGNPLILNNRGNALASLARRYDALESYERALKLKPDYLEALVNRGQTLSEIGRHEEALDCHARAMALSPDASRALPYMPGRLAGARLYVCDWSDYEKTVGDISERCLAGERVIVPFAACQLLDSADLQYRSARIFVEDISPASRQPLWTGGRTAHDRIRLGYVSFDFREHMMAYQIAGIVEHHDRSRFETIALSLYPKAAGPMQERLRNAFDRFVDVGTQGDLEIARLARELEVDILVDLTGHTRGGRMGLFAHRPAPIQVNFNCPGTSGADYLDYIIADRVVVPPEHHRYFSEKVVYLPDTFLPNSPRRISADTPSRNDAGLPERGFVFCSFNNSYKFRPGTFDIWMRLLSRFEDSVLWLTRANETVVGNLQREAKARGVDPRRLIFAPRVDPLEDHLARQRNADLFLDTLPFNAQTTAADALWAGLPVLTCLGGSFSGRVAASALTAIGLSELITGSLEDYEALASSLVQDPGRLQRIRETLSRNRLAYPLFDTSRFTRHLESAFEQMWELHRRGEPPRHFAVAALPGTAGGQ
ncbi:MAG TPA: tetratricopeptide repeat protein [Burkholderiales bacterium]